MVFIGKLYAVFLLWFVLICIQTGDSCKWTSDGKRFILDNFDSIWDSPARVHNYIPLLCPPSLWLYRNYTIELAQKVKIVTGLGDWGTCIRTVSCSSAISALVYQNNIIAVGLGPKEIVIFDALTGRQQGVFSGHTRVVRSLAFSIDGTFLVSGSKDDTIKLWDVQTGGVIKTLHPHRGQINHVAISADNAVAASVSSKFIDLWHLNSGNQIHHLICDSYFTSVAFCPKNTQHLISSYRDTDHSSLGNISQQWSIDGHQIGSPFPGSCPSFSPDGTHFAVTRWKKVIIRNTDSMATVEVNLGKLAHHCCFSPNGNTIAFAAGYIIYLWDITSPHPYLIQTFPGHMDKIISLAFSSPHTLISASQDKTIKFWQINVSQTKPTAHGPEPTLPTSTPIKSVGLQAKDGLAFSIDAKGKVKTWDISTGCCKESCKIKVNNIGCADMQLICDRLIIVWSEKGYHPIQIWDAEKGKLHELKNTDSQQNLGLRIIGGQARVLRIEQDCIKTWSIWTGESAGGVELERNKEYHFDPFCVENSRVLICSKESLVQGWDFGVPGSTPTQFSETSLDRPHLTLTDGRRWSKSSSIIVKDSVTGKEVFQLCGRYSNPSDIRWDGQYLVAGYGSGEMLILDFSLMLNQ